jgi:S1-C subfamily serine protease
VTRRAALVLAGTLAATPSAAQGRAAQPGDAMVFVRVVGDVRIDYRDARQPATRRDVEIATGSGFVISPSGLVLTNRHVVEPDAQPRPDEPVLTVENRRIQVFVGSGGSAGAWEAHVVASDAANDLAALQVTAADLAYLALGDSDAVEPGRGVSVLGFPFGRQAEVAKEADADVVPQVTVTRGSLSASREDDAGETRFLQTDATMLPGNSGGPMLDEDGYVVGVARMKLSADANAPGAGFSVPVNVAKDFLDANGLLERLPVVRLRPGVRHSLDWKGIAVELPEGFGDRSPARVLADAGELGEVAFHAYRWESPWPLPGLEEALLGGAAVPGFVPAPAVPGARATAPQRRVEPSLAGRPASLIGSGTGTDALGRRFRVEFAIVDLGREKVVARYLGPEDAVAFNLGLIRRSLRSLQATPLLVVPPLRSLADASLEWAAFPNAEGGVVLPGAWPREPAQDAACAALPAAEAGLLARHPSDYTIVLRALRLGQEGARLARGLRDCGATRGAERSAYAFSFERLGVAMAVRGAVVERGDERLLVEMEAPVAKLLVVEELYTRWLETVAERRSARYAVAP